MFKGWNDFFKTIFWSGVILIAILAELGVAAFLAYEVLMLLFRWFL